MFIGSAVAVVFVQVIGIIFNYLPSEAVNQQANCCLTLFQIWLLMVHCDNCLSAPLFEELIFISKSLSSHCLKKKYAALGLYISTFWFTVC